MCFVVGCLIWWQFCSLTVYFGGFGGWGGERFCSCSFAVLFGAVSEKFKIFQSMKQSGIL